MAEINLSIFSFKVYLGKKWKGGLPMRVQKVSRRQLHCFFFIFLSLEEDIEEAGTRKLLRRSHTMCMSLIPSSLYNWGWSRGRRDGVLFLRPHCRPNGRTTRRRCWWRRLGGMAAAKEQKKHKSVKAGGPTASFAWDY